MSVPLSLLLYLFIALARQDFHALLLCEFLENRNGVVLNAARQAQRSPVLSVFCFKQQASAVVSQHEETEVKADREEEEEEA